MITETIHCVGPPVDVFSIFLTSEKFTAMTGIPADLSPEVGGASTMFGGMIAALNIEVIEGKRLVQAWRPGNWDEGTYSIARFDFAADNGGTKVTLTHTGYPAESEDHLRAGWAERYWEPLKAHLA